MSDVTSSHTSHAVYGGIIVDVVEDDLARVQKVLSGIPGGVYQAVGSALSRAANSGKTVAKAAVTKEYAISQTLFLSSTRNINHFQKESGGALSVVFGFRGYVIPLIKFNTKVGSDGRVMTQVMRSHAAKALNHAFYARTGSHGGIYERVEKKRLPIRELYGPATPQMMYSNEQVMDNIEEKIVETYEKRIEHEILRVLNGWGK